MVDQAISEHRAAEGSAGERCHHRVSQPGAAQPNRKCERFWTLPGATVRLAVNAVTEKRRSRNVLADAPAGSEVECGLTVRERAHDARAPPDPRAKPLAS